jgi:hypothetical protein
MEIFIALLLGVAVSTAVWVSAIRRSLAKPEGRTAKFLSLLSK